LKLLKSFDEYVQLGTIKKQAKDASRAKSLIKEAERAFISINEILEKIGINDNNSNIIIKDSYDIIMQLIRAKLFLNGFKSVGEGSHEAEISYLKELKFKDTEIQFLNQLRYFRNGIAYYGKSFDKEYAEKVVKFLEIMYSKLSP